jgi:hypothetical protein
VWPQCTQVFVLTLVLVAMQVRVRAIALNRCWFQIDGEQSTSRKTHGVQHKATSFESANYLLSETNSAVFDSRYHRRSTLTERFQVSDSTAVSEGLSPYNTVVRVLCRASLCAVRTQVANPGVTSSPSKLIRWNATSAAARAGGAAPTRRRTAGMNSAAMAFG